MLKLNSVEVKYSGVILVLKGLSLEVPEGSIVTLLGPNGAGKSTALKAISGLLQTQRGEISDGSIEFFGRRVDGRDASDIVKMGIFQVMEGRRVFEHLSTENNLKAGAHTLKNGRSIKGKLEMVYDYFPRLVARRTVQAGYLSGGEQQMLAIGRGLMASPKLMLLDEPSLGLSPMLVQEIFDIIERINQQERATILLVEQNARLALSIAQYGYILESGRVVLDGPAEKLRENEDVRGFYLGMTELGQRKSYREVQHYKRRKRWLS